MDGSNISVGTVCHWQWCYWSRNTMGFAWGWGKKRSLCRLLWMSDYLKAGECQSSMRPRLTIFAKRLAVRPDLDPRSRENFFAIRNVPDRGVLAADRDTSHSVVSKIENSDSHPDGMVSIAPSSRSLERTIRIYVFISGSHVEIVNPKRSERAMVSSMISDDLSASSRKECLSSIRCR